LPPLLEAAQSERGLVIAGLHINYSRFNRDKVLSEYQTVNTPDHPIEGRSKANQEKVFDALARRIEDLLLGPDAGPPSAGLPKSAAPGRPPEYLKWLEARCAGVELLGQDVQQSLAIKLSHVYVPALIRFTHLETGRREVSPRSPEEVLEPLLGLIDKMSLYVSAPAGAGKSTFCRWAALQSIRDSTTAHPALAPEEYQEQVPESLQTRLPLLVPLREFWTAMQCVRGQRSWQRGDLEQALAAWVDRSPPPGLNGSMLKAHLAAGSAFLLLDGLDEVPISDSHNSGTVHPRQLLLSGLADALPAWEKAGNRTLLASRPYGLDEAGLARLRLLPAPLEPLPEPLQELFVRRWFHALQREELAGDLLEAMGSRDDLAPLIENPMLLTAMCVLYDKGGRLPEDRYQLYKSIVDGVLHSRYPGDAREREPVLRRLEAIAYGMHTGEPDEAPRQTPAAEISWNETERLLAEFAEKNPSFGQGEVAAAVQREELLTRSGLLLPRPNERAAFYHLSFQEFLAAQRIARGSEKRVTEVIDAHEGISEWRPTLLFLFAAQLFSKDPEWGLGLLARLLEGHNRAAVKANPAPAVLIAEALELCLAKRYQIPGALAERFRRLSLDAIEDEVEVQARQTLGRCLGRLGDPRIFELRDPRAYVEVPAGTYPYGDEGETVEIEAPFLLGRYPVTNSQYQAFVDDGGYGDRKWWSDAGWAWLQKEGVTEPSLWRDRRFNGPNQPVVGVSFFEAEASCAWAGGDLPTEQEWEAAARGQEGYKYPWGDDWENGICNTREAGLAATSPVGLFPRSRRVQLGLEDLAGNVFEWCEVTPDDPERPSVFRGGCWDHSLDYARCSDRHRYPRETQFDDLGFRVVCSSPS
jgi:formylglycine-generating enzyme required for sulfatase activity